VTHTLDDLARVSLDAEEARATRDEEARQARRQSRLDRFAEEELEDLMSQLESAMRLPAPERCKELGEVAKWAWNRWERP
jgi:hypothetical protein